MKEEPCWGYSSSIRDSLHREQCGRGSIHIHITSEHQHQYHHHQHHHPHHYHYCPSITISSIIILMTTTTAQVSPSASSSSLPLPPTQYHHQQHHHPHITAKETSTQMKGFPHQGTTQQGLQCRADLVSLRHLVILIKEFRSSPRCLHSEHKI